MNLGRHFTLRDIRKNPRSMYARVPQAMGQFVLKTEKLSHIMGPTPILEMARAYGLRPRLWLLSLFITSLHKTFASRRFLPLQHPLTRISVMVRSFFEYSTQFNYNSPGNKESVHLASIYYNTKAID